MAEQIFSLFLSLGDRSTTVWLSLSHGKCLESRVGPSVFSSSHFCQVLVVWQWTLNLTRLWTSPNGGEWLSLIQIHAHTCSTALQMLLIHLSGDCSRETMSAGIDMAKDRAAQLLLLIFEGVFLCLFAHASVIVLFSGAKALNAHPFTPNQTPRRLICFFPLHELAEEHDTVGEMMLWKQTIWHISKWLLKWI